eukprot:TRINITY_DN2333_c0_g2_i2.p1 TRINITY_DN2333_c0_g2~~TRINITY_DN2333_c0_g2_i2.p1  ORF type:complete len:295 (+),score=51.24 TRINITY_DN2333_c0_g2_i2:394-1278(+)
MSAEPRMPVLFICHGAGPFMFIKDEDHPTRKVLKGLDSSSNLVHFNEHNIYNIVQGHFPPHVKSPTAIVLISAHWVVKGDKFNLSGKEYYSGYFDDFTNRFPIPEDVLAKCGYGAKVDLALAEKIRKLFEEHGIHAELDDKREIDQGAFVPLTQILPEAQVPIVSMSILESFDPEIHIRAGKALAELRSQGVLIIGSGSVTHDLTRTSTSEEAHQFVAELKKVLESKDFKHKEEVLCDWKKTLPFATKCHPHPEDHFIPLLTVAGAAQDSHAITLHEEWVWDGARSNASFLFVD